MCVRARVRTCACVSVAPTWSERHVCVCLRACVRACVRVSVAIWLKPFGPCVEAKTAVYQSNGLTMADRHSRSRSRSRRTRITVPGAQRVQTRIVIARGTEIAVPIDILQKIPYFENGRGVVGSTAKIPRLTWIFMRSTSM